MDPPFHRWERRRLPRFDVEQLVSLTFHGDKVKPITGTCKDVSTAGMYCLVDLKIANGVKVDFLLNLPSEAMLVQPVRLRGTGEVVRVFHAPDKHYGLGIRFDSVHLAPTR
ncbi:MAG: PilZ domain-containing protein [Candidatus Korobacteraceae bacterium]